MRTSSQFGSLEMYSDYTVLPSLILVWISYTNTLCCGYWHYMTDFSTLLHVLSFALITAALLSTIILWDKSVCLCVFSVLVCVLYDLVWFLTARGSLLCERMPVLHFLSFVFQTVKPVSESLSACIDAQLHSTCRRRREKKKKKELRCVGEFDKDGWQKLRLREKKQRKHSEIQPEKDSVYSFKIQTVPFRPFKGFKTPPLV